MRNRSIQLAAVSLLALAVAGCSEKKDAKPPPVSGPPPPVAFEQRFGTSFASFFTASNTSDPRDPTAGDVPAASPNTDPLDN